MGRQIGLTTDSNLRTITLVPLARRAIVRHCQTLKVGPEKGDEGGDEGAADTAGSPDTEEFKTMTRGIGATGRPTAAASEAPTTPVLKT